MHAIADLERLLKTKSDHPSTSLLLNAGVEHYTDPAFDGLIAYRPQGSRLLQVGGVVAAPEDRSALLASFVEFARKSRKRVLALELRDHDVESYHALGFRTNEIGRSYTLDISDYHLRGTRFMKLRNKLRQPVKHGIHVEEVGRDIPADAALMADLKSVTSDWLRGKGRHTKLLQLLVGELDRALEPENRVFLAKSQERTLAFIIYTASYGSYPGYMHDLTRRVDECPPGVMELINAKAIERFRSEGVRYLNFGFTPFVGVDDQGATHSRFIKKLMGLLGEYGAALYPAQSQVQYKMKWFPDIIQPEFIAYEGSLGLGDLFAILKATGTI